MIAPLRIVWTLLGSKVRRLVAVSNRHGPLPTTMGSTVMFTVSSAPLSSIEITSGLRRAAAEKRRERASIVRVGGAGIRDRLVVHQRTEAGNYQARICSND